MEVLILLVFVSLTLAASAIAMFVWLTGQRTFEHSDRLVLLPIESSRDGEHRAKRDVAHSHEES